MLSTEPHFQLELFGDVFDNTPLQDPSPASDPLLTLEEKFKLFDAANPQVYRNLRSLCYRWRQQGHMKAGIDTFFGILRWQHAMSTTGDAEGYKLNNNLKSFYARKLMEEPGLAGMFDVRNQRSKGDEE